MSRQPLLDALEALGTSPEDHVRELAKRYQMVFSTPESQLVLEDLKRKFWLYDSTAGEFQKENEGNRQVILYLCKMLVVDTTQNTPQEGEENASD